MTAASRITAAELLQDSRLWTASTAARTEAIATGHSALDRALPGGGWPLGAVVELLTAQQGIGELALLLPALTALAVERRIAFLSPPYLLNAPALARAGVPLARALVLPDLAASDRNWAAEQLLKSGACGAVVLWASALSDKVLRRLQLAALDGRAVAFLYRAARHASQYSPVALRLQLSRGRIDLLKVRGGAPRSVPYAQR